MLFDVKQVFLILVLLFVHLRWTLLRSQDSLLRSSPHLHSLNLLGLTFSTASQCNSCPATNAFLCNSAMRQHEIPYHATGEKTTLKFSVEKFAMIAAGAASRLLHPVLHPSLVPHGCRSLEAEKFRFPCGLEPN